MFDHERVNLFPQVGLFRQIKGTGSGARIIIGDGGTTV
jgi:hypothetical protein